MDANHIIGSVMILFKGYFGTILHTGDMRWSRKLLKTNHLLFNKDATLKMSVDELIIDNTYCDPIFDFPTQVNSLLYIIIRMNVSNLLKKLLIKIKIV